MSSTNNGWIKVTKGFKQQQAGNVKKVASHTSSRNKYELSKDLETKLHSNSGITAMFGGSGSKSEPKAPSGNNFKCYKRNQRRNAKRKQKRIEKQRLLAEEHKISPSDVDLDDIEEVEEEASNVQIDSLPPEVLTGKILPFLDISDLASFGACSKRTKSISENKHHWQSRFNKQFPNHGLCFVSNEEYKLAYKLQTTGGINKQRCFHSKKTFFEDVLGLGIDFTVNPKTNNVDYIKTSQDLFSVSAFKGGIKSDAFGDKYKLFLPLYFSKEHFCRALPIIKSTMIRLCGEDPSRRYFDPNMVLHVIPKIINTFTVLVSSEGVAASKKSFVGLIRIYRLFLALAKIYPSIEVEAMSRIRKFMTEDKFRSKRYCPSLGNFLPLLMIADRNVAKWTLLRSKYINEFFIRSVLWILKQNPELGRSYDKTTSDIDQRLQLTREATQVGMRLSMLQVHFVSFLCRGTNASCATRLDDFLEDIDDDTVQSINIDSSLEQSGSNDGSPQEEQHQTVDGTQREDEPDRENMLKHCEDASLSSKLSFSSFRSIVNDIFTVNSWSRFFILMRAPRPQSKEKMAEILRNAVKESIRKKYHTRNMDFSRIQASGTSKILSKGQQYSAGGLKRVVFTDNWTFDDNVKYLDATCLVYKKKKLVSTVDYRRTFSENAIRHSGDVITDGAGSHTIELDLCQLDSDVTACIFVLSAFADATLLDITSASVSFADANANDASALCTYNLDAHDKIEHLKSIIMCKLYRTGDGRWHVIAIGDSHEGSADNYRPIYSAAKKYL